MTSESSIGELLRSLDCFCECRCFRQDFGQLKDDFFNQDRSNYREELASHSYSE